LGVFFIATGSIILFLLYQHNQKTIPGIRKIRNKSIKEQRIISEMFRFVTFIKNENQELRSLKDIDEVQDSHQGLHVDVWIPGIVRLRVIRLTSNGMRYASIFITIFLLYTGNLTLGAFFLIITYGALLVESLWQITNLHKKFLLDRVNIEKYLELLERKPDILFVDNPISVDRIEGKIEFVDVSFWYPQRTKETDKDSDDDLEIKDEPILNKISFTILPGEKVGIVGESGSGKSTIASLIRRSFDPQDGRVLIDGNDLRLINLGQLLCHIGSVEQEVIMFDRALRDNISFGANRVIPDDELLSLLKLVRIDSFFEKLEYGLDTLVGEKGVKLSGGERQRVGIARALAKKPSVLIFDEATSALDSKSERTVQQSIDDACKGKTSIVIAHRLSTVKNCDRILVFRNGVLLAEGTHDELLRTCEYYSELVRHQMVEPD
jgi:ABC-type multidrug transport system fused ATPase/permease subunit